MATEMSKNQVDRLGERLKKGHITEDDLRLLGSCRVQLDKARLRYFESDANF